MNWIHDNKGLAALLAVILVAGGGLGFWLYGNYSAYSASQQTFDQLRNEVTRLKSRPLYPDQENLDLQAAAAEDYRNAVARLRQSLLEFQPPRRTPTATEFQARLNERITTFTGSARGAGTELPGQFAFDMERYTAVLPSETVVAEVDWQLDALIHLAELLVASGVDEITQFSRTPMPVEDGQQPEANGETDTEPYRIYPIELRFTARQDSFQQVINGLSQPHSSSYYILPRLIRIENESTVGPATGDPIVPTPITPEGGEQEGFEFPSFGTPSPPPPGDEMLPPAIEVPDGEQPADQAPDNGEEFDPSQLEPEPGAEEPMEVLELDPTQFEGGFQDPEFAAMMGMQATGYIDARIILGQERLRIYLRADLLVFIAPPADDETAAPATTDAD